MLPLAALLTLLLGALLTGRGAALDHSHPPPKRASSPSRSNGLPWDGTLTRAVRLRMSAMLRPVQSYARQGHFYGTAELVSLLERTARAVATRWPRSQLAVGELSAARGGKLDGHHSHRSGRDADVAFFMRDEQGQHARFLHFVTFGSEGVGTRARRTLYFDDARNWAVVATMLRDQESRVQYMFVAQTIRTRLLMEARRQGESDEFLRAAAAVLVEPKERHKHDNHFHVRIYCPVNDRPQCQDSAPYWPWYEGAPPGGRHDELPLIRWRRPTPDAPSTASARIDAR
jgi:penicillin-insensitive murein endopeptidase